MLLLSIFHPPRRIFHCFIYLITSKSSGPHLFLFPTELFTYPTNPSICSRIYLFVVRRITQRKGNQRLFPEHNSHQPHPSLRMDPIQELVAKLCSDPSILEFEALPLSSVTDEDHIASKSEKTDSSNGNIPAFEGSIKAMGDSIWTEWVANNSIWSLVGCWMKRLFKIRIAG